MLQFKMKVLDGEIVLILLSRCGRYNKTIGIASQMSITTEELILLWRIYIITIIHQI